jgi:hypothetical protein
MRVLVCGGRLFADRALLSRTLDNLHAQTPITRIVHGAAMGADTLAGEWARANAIPETAMPADWKRNGRQAGPMRNAEMLHPLPDLVIAFDGGKGTANMVMQAEAKNVRVVRVQRPV